MKMSRKFRAQVLILMLSSGGAAPVIGGCISDQQATSILESVITTGLSTLVNAAITGIVENAGNAQG